MASASPFAWSTCRFRMRWTVSVLPPSDNSSTRSHKAANGTLGLPPTLLPLFESHDAATRDSGREFPATGSWIREGSARVRIRLLDGRVRPGAGPTIEAANSKRSSPPAPSRLGPPHSSEGLSVFLSTFSTAEARRSTLASTCPQSPRGYWSNAKRLPRKTQ
jgi:hypothetical protein